MNIHTFDEDLVSVRFSKHEYKKKGGGVKKITVFGYDCLRLGDSGRVYVGCCSVVQVVCTKKIQQQRIHTDDFFKIISLCQNALKIKQQQKIPTPTPTSFPHPQEKCNSSTHTQTIFPFLCIRTFLKPNNKRSPPPPHPLEKCNSNHAPTDDFSISLRQNAPEMKQQKIPSIPTHKKNATASTHPQMNFSISLRQNGRTRSKTQDRKALCNFLAAFPLLVRLDLSFNYLVGCLGEVLQSVAKPLQYLGLRGCDLDAVDLQALGASKHAASIRELNLSKVSSFSFFAALIGVGSIFLDSPWVLFSADPQLHG